MVSLNDKLTRWKKTYQIYFQAKYHKIMCKYLIQKQAFTGIMYSEFYTQVKNSGLWSTAGKAATQKHETGSQKQEKSIQKQEYSKARET